MILTNIMNLIMRSVL